MAEYYAWQQAELEAVEREAAMSHPVHGRFTRSQFLSNSKGRNKPRTRPVYVDLIRDRQTGRTWKVENFPFDAFAEDVIPRSDHAEALLMRELGGVGENEF